MQSSAGSKAVSGLCCVRRFIVRQSDVAGSVLQRRYRCDDPQLRPNIHSPERTKAVTSFYYQSAIDQAAAKVSDGLTTHSGYYPVLLLGACSIPPDFLLAGFCGTATGVR